MQNTFLKSRWSIGDHFDKIVSLWFYITQSFSNRKGGRGRGMWRLTKLIGIFILVSESSTRTTS